MIPGLLQTREYAEWIFSAVNGADDRATVESGVAVRLERQSLLNRRNPKAPTLNVVIDEGVLRRTIGDTLGMQKQLAHLVNVSTRPNVSVRVLPLSAGPHFASSAGSFTILDFPAVGTASPEPTTIYSENLTGALYLEKPREVERYAEAWAELDRLALDQASSDDLIGEILKETDA